ncbi:MAG: ABC transporter ATP-binding protein [Chloroflexi bacterium]|nr:ABC transporter ATP-binding protein [Chloroflexota bacterium]
MPQFAVELRDVVKRFPGPSGEEVYAVKHVSLQIHDGEFFSLLGPSGCGKTTSLRMIAGFELPTTGAVMIHDRHMGETPPFQRPVNTVFQNYALFPHMTVGENVAFGLEMKRVPKTDIAPRVVEALRMVRLPGMEKRKPKQLSGGQQQRIALARALINRPEVLLLDEPLGALDLKLRKEMQLELKTLQREVGITFIYVTHDQEEALTMSDRIAVMSGGEVLQVGGAADIYDRPNCRFVADFIGETNFLRGTVKEQKGKTTVVEVDGGITVRAESENSLAHGQSVTIAVRPEKIHLRPTPGAANAFAGRVEDLVYIGTDTHYGVRFAGDHRVRVREQNTDSASTPLARAGDEVTVSFAEAAARVLVE